MLKSELDLACEIQSKRKEFIQKLKEEEKNIASTTTMTERQVALCRDMYSTAGKGSTLTDILTPDPDCVETQKDRFATICRKFVEYAKAICAAGDEEFFVPYFVSMANQGIVITLPAGIISSNDCSSAIKNLMPQVQSIMEKDDELRDKAVLLDSAKECPKREFGKLVTATNKLKKGATDKAHEDINKIVETCMIGQRAAQTVVS